MKKMYKTGVHTFYRPRAWGDGSAEPSWGTPARDRRDFRRACVGSQESSAEIEGAAAASGCLRPWRRLGPGPPDRASR